MWYNEDLEIDSYDEKYRKIYCNHEWIAIPLIYNVVYNCKKCDAKREEVEKQEKDKF